MMQCPECEYKTQNPKNMRKHEEKTRHGQQRRQSRAHLAGQFKKTKKQASGK